MKHVITVLNILIGFKVGSHNPIFVQLSFQIFLCMMKNVGVHTIQYFHPIISWSVLQKNRTILVLRILTHFTAARASSGGHFVKIFCRIEHGKIKNWLLFWSNRMEIEHVQFHPKHKKMSETCQKLAFTHPIIVLKSGLRNNWMKKLDRVNRPLLNAD